MKIVFHTISTDESLSVGKSGKRPKRGVAGRRAARVARMDSSDKIENDIKIRTQLADLRENFETESKKLRSKLLTSYSLKKLVELAQEDDSNFEVDTQKNSTTGNVIRHKINGHNVDNGHLRSDEKHEK